MGATQQQLLAHGGSSGGFTGLAAAIMADVPWAYYQLGETAGATTYADSSGNGYHLSTLAATLTAGSVALCAPGTSVDFDGNAYISASNNQYGSQQQTTFSGDKAISYCIVVRFDSLASRVPIHLGNINQTGSQGVFLQLLATGALRFQMWDTVGGAYKSFDTAAGVISAGVSYIVHLRRAVGGAAAIFVNGSSVATSALMTGNIGMFQTVSTGGQRIMLGALNGTTPGTKHDGRLQHCAVFASSLSDARITAHYVASGL